MILGSTLIVDTEELKRSEWERLLRALTFTDVDEVEIACYQYSTGSDVVILPRGALSLLPQREHLFTDIRSKPKVARQTYTKQLDAPGYEGQRAAVDMMFQCQQGQIVAPPGRGKTEIGLAFAAECGTRVLIVVHTTDLFNQWVERAKVSVPGMSIGEIRGKTFTVGQLTIAMAQTLKRYVNEGEQFWRQFGALILDECHHSAAETWEWIINVCPAFYRFGLTATEKRADGRQPLVRFYIGPVIYKLKFESQVPIKVRRVRTGFRPLYRGPADWTRLLRTLSADRNRNQLIARMVVREMKKGHTCLVLSRQINHLKHIHAAILAENGETDNVHILTGKVKQSLRDLYLEQMRTGAVQTILATQLADEGLDVPVLSRVFLTFPGKHDGRIIQQIGRAIRAHEGKEDAVIYDFVDDLIPPLARQYVARKHTYKQLGIQVAKTKEPNVTQKKRRWSRKDRYSVARTNRA